jgi:hypothetical protein
VSAGEAAAPVRRARPRPGAAFGKPRSAGDRGQVLVVFALSMAFLVLGLIAVAIDLSQLYAARVRFQDAAEQAAIAGASDVLVCPPGQETPCGQAAENGLPPTLLAGYDSVCEEVGDSFIGRRFTGGLSPTSCFQIASGANQPGNGCKAVPGAGDEVEARVTASIPVSIPIPGMGFSFPVTAISCAAPVLGAQHAAAP